MIRMLNAKRKKKALTEHWYVGFQCCNFHLNFQEQSFIVFVSSALVLQLPPGHQLFTDLFCQLFFCIVLALNCSIVGSFQFFELAAQVPYYTAISKFVVCKLQVRKVT